MLSIQTNYPSLAAQENLRINSDFQSKTIQRVTSGFRINSSGDDAAGLVVANQFRSNQAELMQGVRNANDGVSTLQIIDGGLNNISKMLDRMKTLATQASSTTFTGARGTLDAEFQTLLSEVDRQAANVGLNGGGNFAKNWSVYIGGGSNQANSQVSFDLTAAQVDSAGLGLTGAKIDGSGFQTGAWGTSSADLTGGTKFAAGGSQTFAFTAIGAGNKAITATIAGGTDGITGSQVLDSLNTQLSPYGITAGTDANGKLQFSSGTTFTLASVSAAGAGTSVVVGTNTAAAGNANGIANGLAAITSLNSAIQNLGVVQGKVGAGQNDLAYATNLAESQIASFSAAESRIRDADMAAEAANLTKAQVLQQASLAAMAQANSAPQAVLSLLKG